MADSSNIEWTDASWNPVTGCNKVSPGCKNCYAETMTLRLKAMGEKTGSTKYANGFKVTLHPDVLEVPLQWKKPRRIFVNSMSDLFHVDVPDDFIFQVFDVMQRAPQHQYQVLTKRPERVAYLNDILLWTKSIWMGTSVENADYQWRIDALRNTDAQLAFLSLEPLLGPLPDLDLRAIDWVIVGGESGLGARPMDLDWARDIRDQCVAAGVPFFFKQVGGVQKHRTGRELDGRTWDEMPRLQAGSSGGLSAKMTAPLGGAATAATSLTTV